MLGVLCARPKPWILNSLISHFHGPPSAQHSRVVPSQPQPPFSIIPHPADSTVPPRHHSSSCNFVGSNGGAACIWRVIQPCHHQQRGSKRKRRRKSCSGSNSIRRRLLAEPKGEGSWNAAWDARPARWLHRPDSAWLLFGVCACHAPIEGVNNEERSDALDFVYEVISLIIQGSNNEGNDVKHDGSPDYKVTGVLADGRCLFRAIAHGMCLRSGEEAPDENRQRELADELRAQVVDELLKRREESEWFIEGDFDAYVKRIQQPYVWGGEPELLMASHVLKTMISVFMRTSGNLVNIANYGEEYQQDEVKPINVLFHGYGHYELLETSDQTYLKIKV